MRYSEYTYFIIVLVSVKEQKYYNIIQCDNTNIIIIIINNEIKNDNFQKYLNDYYGGGFFFCKFSLYIIIETHDRYRDKFTKNNIEAFAQ